MTLRKSDEQNVHNGSVTFGRGIGEAEDILFRQWQGYWNGISAEPAHSGAIDEVIQRGDDKNLPYRNDDGEVERKRDDMISVQNEHGNTSEDETGCHRDASWAETTKSAHAGAHGEQAHVVCNKDNQYVIGDIYLHCKPLSEWRGNVGARISP